MFYIKPTSPVKNHKKTKRKLSTDIKNCYTFLETIFDKALFNS